jgi:signal transduction histidine kinase
VIHDLSNSISGISSLSRYHLRGSIADSELKESLELIQQSADSGRDLISTVANLLNPMVSSEEIIKASDLIRETGQLISILIPKSLQFETRIETGDIDLISVFRNRFLWQILTVAALQFRETRAPAGEVSLEARPNGKRIEFRYRSSTRPPLRFHPALIDRFKTVGTGVKVSVANPDETSEVIVAFARTSI